MLAFTVAGGEDLFNLGPHKWYQCLGETLRLQKRILAEEREEKLSLLLALPEVLLANSYDDCCKKRCEMPSKSIEFEELDESKKMQKYILKQQFEGFSVSNSEGLHKGYDRFQSLLSQLEIHGVGVDSLNFDDLYNNLRVFENDVKGSTASSSSTQNVAFVSENTSSTNDVSTAYSVSNPSGQNSQYEQTSSYSLLANQSSCPQLDHEDLEQLDEYDLEEMDLKWQVAMISIRMKKFYKKTEGVDWTSQSEEEEEDYALIACNSSGSETETQPSEPETQTSKFDTCESNISTETPKLVTEPIVNESNIACQPKVWFDAPIIEEYESYSEDEYASIPTKEQETPSFANQQVKIPRETIKNYFTHSKNPKVDKKELRYGFTARACFVCGSLNHLIRDCDFHEKRMTKQAELNNRLNRISSQRGIRPIWNNVQRVNNQNKFVPTAVLTRTGKILVNTARASGTKNVSTARHSFNRQAVLTSVAMKVNIVKPILVLLGEKGKLLLSPQQVVIGDHKDTTGTMSPNTMDYPHRALKNKGIVDSGCSRHMTGNKAYLAEFQDFNGGPVAFGGSKGYITGKGKIKTGKLDFEDVCFVKELQHFNLFSVSQMCDKKNKVLFTDSECLVLSPEFKLPDENQVLLKIPRQNNMYSFNLENIVPSGGLACLIAKATTDESNKWHRRLGHVNFKNLNKLVKGNLVRGLPSKLFQNDHTCVACQKGKQHKASCKAKAVSSISHTLQLLHMDLFGPTSVRSLNHKTYCLVITDDFSRFSWVFFLRTKDETSGILKEFIRQIENQLNQKVKTIRSDNGTEFKNRDVIEFCGLKGIKREYSNARTPQQNGVAERKNRTLIEAARTMLADSFLPNTFWAEAVSTACYVYRFAGKSDEGFLVGYSLQSKAFRVYNLETKRVEENLHITFLENKPNVAGKGPTWLFDLDYLTDSMNYHPVISENQANHHAGQQEANQNAGTEDIIDAGDSEKEDESTQDCFVLPIWPSYSSTITPDLKTAEKRDGPREEEQVFMDELERLKSRKWRLFEEAEALRKKFEQETENLVIQEGAAKPSSTNIFSTVSTPAKASSTNFVNTVSIPVSTASPHEGLSLEVPNKSKEDCSEIPPLEDIYQNSTDGIFTTSSYDDEGAVADFTNLETVVNVSPIPTSRIHSSHPIQHLFRRPTQQFKQEAKDEGGKGYSGWRPRRLRRNELVLEDVLSTDKDKVSTDMEKVSTDRPIVSTDGSKVSTDRHIEGTDEQVEHTEEHNEGTEKHIKGTDEHIESTDGQRKGSSQHESSQSVSRERRKLESDEEMDRKIQEEWEGEEERNRIAEEKAANDALIRNFDDIKARIEADRLLAEKLQEQKESIYNRRKCKHAELKIKKFEEVQVLYKKIKRSDEDFISIGSAKDERLIKRMNEKGVDSSKSEVLKEESKEEV
ncbi:putative ribonuclease H-like domain-containing protein [Tanacetum coccineum]|uniref:Ribonuclease H-like domain-containing protein n=1 Tax=Tanacetum coccineum TaxID=301880 RepID=A0ABQ5AHM2_9ASTR